MYVMSNRNINYILIFAINVTVKDKSKEDLTKRSGLLRNWRGRER